MAESLISSEAPRSEQTRHTPCHLCGRGQEHLIPLSELPEELRAIIQANAPPAEPLAHICFQCVELFQRAKAQTDAHAAIFEQTNQVLPTPLRLAADQRFAGRDVTIAFLDSGFYAHPDLTRPSNRIVAYKSIFTSNDDMTSLDTVDVSSWHGMMTSVVAAGNGYLSDGFYRAIAPPSQLVLVKIGRTGHILEENIQRGLEWVLEHREQYGIRIVNISAGGDFEQSYLVNPLCRVVEEVVRQGLIVVCAVGNAGMTPGHVVLPPASAPAAISVGGLDDQNSLDRARRRI